ncbi:uncharacterized protein LOC111099227 [Crassostrea virginica]
MAETAMTELNVDFGKEKDDWAEITLSKTEMQRNRTLRDIKFSDYEDSIEKIPTAESLGIRITINGELYGYDIRIPEGHKIYADKTEITPEKKEIKVKVFKETKFNLKGAQMR